jgi:hypothetical protein
MVIKYSKGGTPWHEPPYTKEELRELESRVYGAPVAIASARATGERLRKEMFQKPQPGEAEPEPERT